MFSIIGILVVFGAVVGGYLMEKGNLMVLVQPAELVIIGGAAVGTVLIANPLHILKKIAGGIAGVFGGTKYSKARYLETCKMLYDTFNRARRNGLVALEGDVEDPSKSEIFSKYKAFLNDHHVRDFVCDTLRMATSGGIEPFDLDQMIENDMEVHHHGATQPIAALSTMADSLPGLGIVAAVLGVVITMGALGGPPEEIGHKVAAALVGTFLGILLCYGLIGPVSQNMAKAADDEHAYYQVLRVAMIAFVKGLSPVLAIEMARRSIPSPVRPSFLEVEGAVRGGGSGGGSQAPAAA
jgi:chemotaxis protein MotA